ncbi:hypothetical protein AB0M31_36110 [Streptomyces sp. NPDC051773]
MNHRETAGQLPGPQAQFPVTELIVRTDEPGTEFTGTRPRDDA